MLTKGRYKYYFLHQQKISCLLPNLLHTTLRNTAYKLEETQAPMETTEHFAKITPILAVS